MKDYENMKVNKIIIKIKEKLKLFQAIKIIKNNLKLFKLFYRIII